MRIIEKTILASLCASVALSAEAITTPVSVDTTITGTDSFTGQLAVNSGITLTIGKDASRVR